MTCSIGPCEKPAAHRGLCHAHYKKLLVYGDPLAGKTSASPGEAARFIEAAKAYFSEACLVWPFARNGAGYGHLRIAGKNILAHRIICEAFHGPAPFPKAEASHQCGNGHLGCVNGQHLLWKDRQGNADDMVAHGRSQRGEKMHMARLTEDAVRLIWLRHDLTNDQLGIQFGVTPYTIRAVRKRISWRWLTDTLPQPEVAA